MILTVTPNPCVDKTLFYDVVELGTRPRASRYGCIPGGKGNNVARAVKALCRKSTAFVLVGGPPGQHVVDMIKGDDGVPCIPCWVRGMTRTITTVFEEKLPRQTAFFEPGPSVTAEERHNLVEQFQLALSGVQVVAFCGTVPDPALEDLYRELIPLAHAAGAKTILDSHGNEFRLGLKAVPNMVKPNREEAAQFLGRALDNEKDLVSALDHFHGLGVELVVISLGAEGVAVSRAGERLRVRPPKIEEVNPVGSGDSLVAGFAVGLAEGWPLEQMARWGAAAGTANAMNWDIGHFRLEEVEALVRQIKIEQI